MKVKLNHWYNLMTGVLLSLLGFSSCDNDEDDGNICLYGTPTANYTIKGKVTDSDGKPINGVKVVANITYTDGHIPMTEPVFTDKKGEYLAETEVVAMVAVTNRDLPMEVTFEDVDGEDNGGTFANDTVRGKDITIKRIEKGDGNWYRGTYELTANKTLKKK